jgi:hypothetical protein
MEALGDGAGKGFICARISACCAVQTALSVMAGLVPAIHAAPVPTNLKVFRRLDAVDARDKPGHEGVGFLILSPVGKGVHRGEWIDLAPNPVFRCK